MKKLVFICCLLVGLPLAAWSQPDDLENSCGRTFRAIRANAYVTGKLKKKGGPDYYQVTLRRPGILTASVRKHRTAVVDIQDGLCRNIPAGGSPTSRAVTLGEGVWFIKVYSTKGRKGDYKLYVRFKPGKQAGGQPPLTGVTPLPQPETVDDHSNDCGHTTEVFIGSTQAGSFQGSRDVDVFHIVLDLPTQLRVWTRGKADTAAELRDSFCRPLRTSKGGGVGKNFNLKAGLQPGKYFIAVRRNGGKVNDYTLVLKGAPLEESKPAVNLQLDGKWKWTKTGVSNTLGLPMNTEKGTAVFKQSNKQVQVTYSKLNQVKGLLHGNTFAYGQSHTKGATTISEKVEIVFDSNNHGKGIGNWEIKGKGGGVHEYTFERISK